MASISWPTTGRINAVVQQDEVDIRFRPAITTAERTDCRERQTLRFTNHALVRERTFPQLNESSLGERRPLGSRNSPGRGDGGQQLGQLDGRRGGRLEERVVERQLLHLPRGCVHQRLLAVRDACAQAFPAQARAGEKAYAAWQMRHKGLLNELDNRVTLMIRGSSKDEKDYMRNVGKYEGTVLEYRNGERDELLAQPRDPLALQWAQLWDFYRGDAVNLRAMAALTDGKMSPEQLLHRYLADVKMRAPAPAGALEQRMTPAQRIAEFKPTVSKSQYGGIEIGRAHV